MCQNTFRQFIDLQLFFQAFNKMTTNFRQFIKCLKLSGIRMPKVRDCLEADYINCLETDYINNHILNVLKYIFNIELILKL